MLKQSLSDQSVNLSRWPAPDKDWWRDAAKRIDAIRKVSVEIRVVNARGEPIPNHCLVIHQTHSQFGWGSAVSEQLLGQEDINDDLVQYREAVGRLFPLVTLENGHKWRSWEDPDRRRCTDQAMQWLDQHNIRVRGHTLAWQHKTRTWSLPDDVYFSSNAEFIRTRIENHFADILRTYRGKFTEWDVVNEVWSEHVLTDRLFPDVSKELAPELVAWFRLAKLLEPESKLYINDYGIIESGGYENTDHQNSYDATIAYLVQQKAPLEGIGIQGHFGSGPVPRGPMIWRILDRYARFNLPIRITEFDIFGDGWNEAAESDYLEEFFTACMAHPAVNGLIIWGFWDGAHWFGNAPIYRKDWTLKPSGQRYMDLVQKEWTTHETATTGDDGRVSLRVFKGDYKIDINGHASNHSVVTDGQIISIKLPG